MLSWLSFEVCLQSFFFFQSLDPELTEEQRAKRDAATAAFLSRGLTLAAAGAARAASSASSAAAMSSQAGTLPRSHSTRSLHPNPPPRFIERMCGAVFHSGDGGKSIHASNFDTSLDSGSPRHVYLFFRAANIYKIIMFEQMKMTSAILMMISIFSAGQYNVRSELEVTSYLHVDTAKCAATILIVCGHCLFMKFAGLERVHSDIT